MEDKVVTIYVVKYALTKGIYEVQANPVEGGKYFSNLVGREYFFLSASDVTFTPEHAERCARDKAARKAKSLRKQLDKLRDLQQTPKWAK